MTLLEKLDRLPPCVARLFAKDENGKLMTDVELTRRTGWGLKRLRTLYRSASWSHVHVGDVDVFLKACGLSWSSQRRQRYLLMRHNERNGDITKMRHLKYHDFWKWPTHKIATYNNQLAQCKKLLVKLLSPKQ